MVFCFVKFIIEFVGWIVNRTRVLVKANVDYMIGAVLFLSALGLYLRTMPPTVLDGDSGEYQYMAYILGVPSAARVAGTTPRQ